MKDERVSLRLEKESTGIIDSIVECCGCSKTDAVQLALDMVIGNFTCDMIKRHYDSAYPFLSDDKRKVRYLNNAA